MSLVQRFHCSSNANYTWYTYNAVVIWSDMFGGILIGEEPLPWSGPLLPTQISGGRTETGQTSQCCLLPGNVWRPLYCILPLNHYYQNPTAFCISAGFFKFSLFTAYKLAEEMGLSIILCLGVGSSCSLFSSCDIPIIISLLHFVVSYVFLILLLDMR